MSLALAVVLWAALLPEAAAQSPQRIGIVVTTAVNLDDSEADALTAALGQALEQSLGVVVTAGAETRRRLPLDGVPAGCVGEAACRTDLGERLDADELLMTVAARVGNRVQLDITWVDVASGKVASRPAIVLEGDADRTAALRDAGKVLLPHIQPMSAPGETRGTDPEPVRPTPARRRGHHMTTGTWLAAGVSVAALGGALGFGYRSRSIYNTEECADATCQAEKDSLATSNLIGDGLAVVSVAAGITALILYLGSDEGAEPAGERAGASRPGQPVVGLGAGPGGIQISIGGAF